MEGFMKQSRDPRDLAFRQNLTAQRDFMSKSAPVLFFSPFDQRICMTLYELFSFLPKYAQEFVSEVPSVVQDESDIAADYIRKWMSDSLEPFEVTATLMCDQSCCEFTSRFGRVPSEYPQLTFCVLFAIQPIEAYFEIHFTSLEQDVSMIYSALHYQNQLFQPFHKHDIPDYCETLRHLSYPLFHEQLSDVVLKIKKL